MNDLCFEYSQDVVFFNSFDCAFAHKELRCTNKTEIKVWLQYTNEKLSLVGDIIIYTPEDLVTN